MSKKETYYICDDYRDDYKLPKLTDKEAELMDKVLGWVAEFTGDECYIIAESLKSQSN